MVGLITEQQNEAKANEYLDELAFLADTAGAETVKTFLQRLDYPNPRTFVGKGKLDEIREFIEDNDIGMAISDDDLTSKQVLIPNTCPTTHPNVDSPRTSARRYRYAWTR